MTQPPAQLPLALPPRPLRRRADFLVGRANEAAAAWIDRWPDWPAPSAVLWGPPGSGKSHLAETWAERAAALVLPLSALPAHPLESLLGRRVLLDPAGPEDVAVAGRALFHLANLAREPGGGVLLVAETPPGRWEGLPPDTASRLATWPTFQLGPPDDALFAALLVKQFAERQVSVGPELIAWLARRLPRTAAEAARAAQALDAAALAAGRAITVALARQVLALPAEGDAPA